MITHKNNYSNLGTIKYIGEVKDKAGVIMDGIFYGVELDTATGKINNKNIILYNIKI